MGSLLPTRPSQSTAEPIMSSPPPSAPEVEGFVDYIGATLGLAYTAVIAFIIKVNILKLWTLLSPTDPAPPSMPPPPALPPSLPSPPFSPPSLPPPYTPPSEPPSPGVPPPGYPPASPPPLYTS